MTPRSWPVLQVRIKILKIGAFRAFKRMTCLGKKHWIEMEENTNFDFGTLYEDSKNQKTVQGDFSLKKTKKAKQNKKKPKSKQLNTIILTTVCCFFVVWVFSCSTRKQCQVPSSHLGKQIIHPKSCYGSFPDPQQHILWPNPATTEADQTSLNGIVNEAV